MGELQPLLWALAYAYGAAAAGLLAACCVRAWACRSGRLPSAAETAWTAFLPLIAVLVLPVASALQPHAARPLIGMHAVWHQWERAVHSAPVAHGVLHVANLLLLLLAAICAARTLYALAQMRAFGTALRAAGRRDRSWRDAAPLYRLSTKHPTVFTTGVLRPAVYASTGLLDQLSSRDREAMLAHETAHARRRDGLTGTLLTAFYTLFPLPGGRTLCADWLRAAERACDADAALRLGSHTDVAAALVRVARLVGRSPGSTPGGACFAAAEDDIEGRVRALLSPSAADAERSCPPALSGWLVTASLGMLCATSFWVGHAVELFVRH